MERAVRLIKNDKYSKAIIDEAAIVQGIWPQAVGKAIARHTGNLKIVRECLVVEVEDAEWQKQLHALRGQIVQQVQKLTGNSLITRVEFRVGVPRRAPQRAEEPRTPVLQPGGIELDEADSIKDPVLKKVYQLSRKRATA
jgi:predicted nucleic acid-binding Zn ribbon protein